MALANKISLTIKAEMAELRHVREILEHDDLEIIHYSKNYPEHSHHNEFSKTSKEINQTDNASGNNLGTDFIPSAENIDFIEKGKIIVRVMDKHNFYEIEPLSEEFINEADVGLLTKLWIYISKAVK